MYYEVCNESKSRRYHFLAYNKSILTIRFAIKILTNGFQQQLHCRKQWLKYVLVSDSCLICNGRTEQEVTMQADKTIAPIRLPQLSKLSSLYLSHQQLVFLPGTCCRPVSVPNRW